MCGRLTLTSSFTERIRKIFDGALPENIPAPNYNITPGQSVPALSASERDAVRMLPWGYEKIAAEGAAKRMLINARSETVDRLPTFRDAFRSSRCVIFADGFYEWHRAGSSAPQPYFFQLEDGMALPMAGLLLPDAKADIPRCVILTTEANSLMHRIHHRMPVIFTPDGMNTWLETDTAPETLKSMMQPFPSARMISYPVSRAVNRSSASGPRLIEKVQVIEQTNLF